LIEKNWILKIRRGTYVIAPLEAGEKGAAAHTVHSFVIASLLTKPYYIGYWSALNYHGLTEQTPTFVYVATPNKREPRDILDTHFVFVKIHPRKMFGTEETEIEKRKVTISSPEKTIVDCLDLPEYCGGTEELAKALYFSKDELDVKKVVDYAKKIGNTAVVKRLGYICEVFGWDDYLKLLFSVRLKSGYSMLDPTHPREGRIKERWKLLINASIDPKRWTR
jgi:predicted transcriptional regulator of viral defense system